MDIREIARRARVSTATVSRAINHVPTVDSQLAKRVWKIVDELGYFPNTQARGLVSGNSDARVLDEWHNLGPICHGLDWRQPRL